MEAIGGLHHLTAITGDARGNLRFYTHVLGMRLVKKTVNQDDVSAYHLFYADAVGSPGSDVTFFDWPGTPANQPGAGTIGPVALRVADGPALEWWRAAFQRLDVPHGQIEPRGGTHVLPFQDPEGQRLELVADGGLPGGTPWDGSPVPAGFQVKGLHGVAITSLLADLTTALLVDVMGFREVDERPVPGGASERVLEVGPGGPGAEVRLLVPQRAEWGRPGRGGVHHVAFRVPDDATHLAWRGALERAGMQVTPVIDRFYFKSIYFREPGGALFEIATDGPGFTADEPASELGLKLALPPFLEPQRAEIEAGLLPIT